VQIAAGRSHEYECIGEAPYERANGRMTVIRTWRSACAVCETLFVQTSGKKLPRYAI